MSPTGRPDGLLGAGSRAFAWLKQLVSIYGTAAALAQLLPAAIALAAVFLSPTAWLSATLRRWVVVGALLGTLAGMVLLARRAGIGELRRVIAGERLARARELGRLAWWALGVAVAAGLLLRLHLAVVDVGFASRYAFAQPLFDFYLAGGDLAATLYNLLAGLLCAATVAGLVAGGPAALLRLRERAAARRALSSERGPLSGLEEAIKALDGAKSTLVAAQSRLVELQAERDELAARLERFTSAAAPPVRRRPRAAAGRPPR